MGCSASAALGLVRPGALAVVDASRCHTCSASTLPASTAAARPPRHDPVAVVPAMNTGAAAQPRLPLMPCTEKPWPSRWGETLVQDGEVHRGRALPSPASAAPA
jgi:hypothetical protein